MSPARLSTDASGDARAGTTGILAWAIFLACSWTWCIGMFLPLVLLRDYGPASWFLFLLPNVVGAAAMGFVLRDAQPRLGNARQPMSERSPEPTSLNQSELLVAAHAPALRLFSLVTIAFHVVFAIAVLGPLASLTPSVPFVMIALLGGLTLALLGGERLAGVGVLALSVVGVVGWYLSSGEASLPEPEPVPQPLADPKVMLWLAPGFIAGFLLCPYLDLTFHRARQALPARAARLAFLLGFAGFFAILISFTAIYAPFFFQSYASRLSPKPAAMLTFSLGLHLSVQAAFTIAVHLRALGRPVPSLSVPNSQESTTLHVQPWRASPRLNAWVFFAAIVILLGLALPSLPRVGFVAPPDLSSTASVDALSWYSVFMGFYGIVFPAYVAICMVPSWRRPARPTMLQLALCFVAIATASPLYWRAFAHRETPSAALATAIIATLASVALVISLMRRARPNPQSQSAS